MGNLQLDFPQLDLPCFSHHSSGPKASGDAELEDVPLKML